MVPAQTPWPPCRQGPLAWIIHMVIRTLSAIAYRITKTIDQVIQTRGVRAAEQRNSMRGGIWGGFVPGHRVRMR
jgi:hypothetical protein